MKRLNQFLVLGGIAVLVCLINQNLAAQDQPAPRGNFDPAQFRQRMMDRYKERLEVTSDDEWKVIQDRIEKVTQLQRDLRIGGPGGPGGRRGPGGGDAAQTGTNGLRDIQKDKETKLVKAQEDLRKILSVRQEATAVLLGLLK